MAGDIDLVGIGTDLLRRTNAVSGVAEAEAYVSSNVFTMARVETLALPGVRGMPSIQQIKRIEDVGASVKVVVGGAVGQASTRDLSPGSLDRLVEMAVGSARIMAPDPNFVSLAKPIARLGPSLPLDTRILDGSV